jgi:hypothetical protein
MLYKYIESIEGNESFLKPFVALMDKQKRFKPITLLNGLSVYKQANTANYFYRINNSKWNLNTRVMVKYFWKVIKPHYTIFFFSELGQYNR